MKEFVARENIRRFEAQLASCVDPEQREILQELLAQARRQLSDAQASSSQS